MASATMRDVAQKANVSIKTVSRVVNEQGEISEATRQRVLAVIQELGYRPNKLARGLVTQRSYTVGLVVPDITNPFFPEVARGVQDVARALDYNVFLCNSDENQQEELRTLHSLAGQGVDGIIIFPCYQTHDNLNIFADQYRPIIAINHVCEHPNVNLVLTDNYQGAKLAVDYLQSKGHRQIGMLAGLETSPLRGRRVRGFLDALAAYDLPVVEPRVLPGSPTLAGGYEVAVRLLKQDAQLTAIFAYNDLQALGAIQACKELGRRVPVDCAIIGFDDIQLAALVNPALTTIRIDKYSIGQQAMKRLLEMLDNPEATFSPIEVGVDLVIRESA